MRSRALQPGAAQRRATAAGEPGNARRSAAELGRWRRAALDRRRDGAVSRWGGNLGLALTLQDLSMVATARQFLSCEIHVTGGAHSDDEPGLIGPAAELGL